MLPSRGCSHFSVKFIGMLNTCRNFNTILVCCLPDLPLECCQYNLPLFQSMGNPPFKSTFFVNASFSCIFSYFNWMGFLHVSQFDPGFRFVLPLDEQFQIFCGLPEMAAPILGLDILVLAVECLAFIPSVWCLFHLNQLVLTYSQQ